MEKLLEISSSYWSKYLNIDYSNDNLQTRDGTQNQQITGKKKFI